MLIRLLGLDQDIYLPAGFKFTDKNDYDILLWHSGDCVLPIENKILVHNCDVAAKIDFNNVYLISYGMSSKSTITASSISSKKMMVCLQRSMINVYNEIIEPHEYSFYLRSGSTEDDSLAIAALLLLCKAQK